MYEPNHAIDELSVKLSIELTELIESYKDKPTPDTLERIELKEQLLKELREFLAKKNKEVK
jgi:hypothetical protein